MAKTVSEDQARAARAAIRIERALDAAEELRGSYDDLVSVDANFADDWRLRGAQADAHISFLRAALEWARRAAAGDEGWVR